MDSTNSICINHSANNKAPQTQEKNNIDDNNLLMCHDGNSDGLTQTIASFPPSLEETFVLEGNAVSNNSTTRTTMKDVTTATATTMVDDSCKQQQQQPPLLQSPPRRHQRIAFVVFASLYTFLFGGAFYGWGPMQLMLEANGSYSSVCHNNDNTSITDNNQNDDDNDKDDDEICSKQTSSLLRIQFVSSLTVLLAPFLGYIIDKYGPLRTFYIMTMLVSIALIALGIASNNTNLDPLLYISFSSFGTVANIAAMLSVQTGMILFPPTSATSSNSNYTNETIELYRSRIISFLNALFDGGSITYLGLWYLSNEFNLSLTEVTIIYAIIAIFCFSGGIYYWTIFSITSITKTISNCNNDENNSSNGAVTATNITPKSTNDPVADLLVTTPTNDSMLLATIKESIYPINNVDDVTTTGPIVADIEKLEAGFDNKDNNTLLITDQLAVPVESIQINDPTQLHGNSNTDNEHRKNSTSTKNNNSNKQRNNNDATAPTPTSSTTATMNNLPSPTTITTYIKIANRTPEYKQLVSEPFVCLCCFFFVTCYQ